jgi:hypothetical protein
VPWPYCNDRMIITAMATQIAMIAAVRRSSSRVTV